METDTAVPSGGTLVAGTYTLKAKAWKTGFSASAVTPATYSVPGQVGIFGGPTHTLAVRADGTVWAWGDNTNGALGDGTTVPRWSPVQLAGMAGVRTVSAGYLHSVALMSDATVKAWGVNTVGEVGDGTTIDRWTPTAVPGLKNVVAIDAGVLFTLALQAAGTVVSWGRNGQGQLGDGSLINRSTPVAVPGLTNVVAVAAGLDHSLALKSDGTVWAWGDNLRGQVGDGTLTRRTAPVQVAGLINVVSIDAGFYSSAAIKTDGTVWRWGSNSFGEIGDGTLVDRTTPVQMTGIANAARVAARNGFTAVLKTNNTVWTVGSNAEAQLGAPGPNRSVAAQVAGLPAITALNVADAIAYPQTADGTAWAWGQNAYGNIGDGSTIARPSPVQISGPGLAWMAAPPALSVAAGTYSAPQSVVVTNPQSGVDMHYTISGAEPTQADPAIASGGTIPVDATQTLKVAAWKTGFIKSATVTAAYTLTPAKPTYSLEEGTYTTIQTVTILSATSDTAIRFTLDGSTPTQTSTLYSKMRQAAATTGAETEAMNIAHTQPVGRNVM